MASEAVEGVVAVKAKAPLKWRQEGINILQNDIITFFAIVNFCKIISLGLFILEEYSPMITRPRPSTRRCCLCLSKRHGSWRGWASEKDIYLQHSLLVLGWFIK